MFLNIYGILIGETNVPKSSLNQSELLENAYDLYLKVMLDDFFNEWEKELPAFKLENIKNDTVKTIYEIFNSFYQPFDLTIFGSRLKNYYNKISYCVIQNTLEYSIVDTIVFNRTLQWPIISRNIIADFRPDFLYKNIKCVFLSSKYISIINKFICNTSNIKGNFSREHFISKAIKFDMINDHDILTDPYCSSMYINKNFTKALIHCRIVNQWGRVQLEKTNGNWAIVKSKL